MPGYDPECDGPYGLWLKSKSVRTGVNGRARTDRVVDGGVIPEGQPFAGERFQKRRDELGNEVTERSASLGVSTGQDVTVTAPNLHMAFAATERRSA